MVFQEKLGLVPLVTFDRPFTLNDLGIDGKKDAERIWNGIVQRAKNLLDTHVTFLEPSISFDRTQHAG